MKKQTLTEIKQQINLIKFKINHCKSYLKELANDLKQWQQAEIQMKYTGSFEL